MDISSSSSFKKTYKSNTSYKHKRIISIEGGAEDDAHYEQQPILSHSHHNPAISSSPEVILKIDNDNDDDQPPTRRISINRESSLDFWNDDSNTVMQSPAGFEFQEDPPAKLIGQFLNKQKAAGIEVSLDMDLEMEELRPHPNFSSDQKRDHFFLSNNNQASKEIRVSFQAAPISPTSDDIRSNNNNNNVVDISPIEQQNNADSSSDDEEDVSQRRRRSLIGDVQNADSGANESQVLKCTSFQRRYSNLGSRLKTKSRLMDLPDVHVPDKKSGTLLKSGQLRSGMLGRASGLLSKRGDEEDDDPLFDEDIPDEYKKAKFDAPTILQWISLVLIVTALSCTLSISKLKRKSLRGLSVWKWEVLILVLICGRLVSGWAIRIVVFFIERNFFMRKRVLYFVYGVRSAVQNCIWLGLVLIAWHSMFDNKVEGSIQFLAYVNKLMVCMLVGTLLWLVKTLMVKVLASSFHVSTFFDRIQESLFNQYVIETLSGPPLIEIKNQQEEEDRTMAEIWRLQNAGATLPPELRAPTFQPTKSGKVLLGPRSGGLPPKVPPVAGKGVSFRFSGQLPKNEDDQGGIPIDKLHKLNHKNVSAWNMKRLIKVVKNGVLTTLDERLIDSAQGGDEAATEIRSEYEAKGAARKVFRNVAKPRAKFIYVEDLMRFLQEDEALKTFNIVEGSAESEKISKASLKNWVVNAFRERKALALTLNDTKTAVNKLHQMVNVIVGIIIIIICLVILEIASSKFLLYVSSQIVVVAFIFGNTLKTIFEAIIFVFVMHPFDVGDRCEVDGVQMIVEEMNILTTVFLRFDNQKILYPNVTLATKPISNYYRSPDMGDSVDFVVHIATPAEKIGIIKQRITSYIENRSDHWYPAPSIILMNLEDLRGLKLSVWIRHRMNHQDMGEKWKRRALLVEEMVNIFKEVDIEYRLYPIDINIRAMPLPAPHFNSNRIPPTWTTPPQAN